ncbi:MAG: hypothetical protein QGF32_02280 [Candidatus Thalassarchaeaceae archaeon]|nr:hypothetical protein [Candidatus Thalassarchaeaceae archaeon]
MVLKRVFKKPTRLGLFGATILAFFESVNSSGFSDNIATRMGIVSPESIPEGKEKIMIPEGADFEIWGNLEIGVLDYAIVASLIYTLVALWVHRPIQNQFSKNKSRKLIAVKSIRSIRMGIIFLLIALLSTANKMGKFADMANNVFGETTNVGSLGRHDGDWGFQEFEWGLLDIIELFSLYFLFLYFVRKGLEVDKAILNPIPDNRNFIEKIWGGIREAERDQRSDIEGGAVKANESFTNLVKLLGAAASMNVAAASLDEGNVKVAFNKWKNLTHRKGKQNKDWRGLSESLNQAGNFPEEEE